MLRAPRLCPMLPSGCIIGSRALAPNEVWLIPADTSLAGRVYFSHYAFPFEVTERLGEAAFFESPEDAIDSFCVEAWADSLIVFRLSSVLERDALGIDDLVEWREVLCRDRRCGHG